MPASRNHHEQFAVRQFHRLRITELIRRIARRLADERRICVVRELVDELLRRGKCGASDDDKEFLLSVDRRMLNYGSHEIPIQIAVATAILTNIQYDTLDARRIREREHSAEERVVRLGARHRNNGAIADVDRSTIGEILHPVDVARMLLP